MNKYCITKWGAILKVNSVKDGLVDVSDPDAIDAGQIISDKEVETYWHGYRVEDKLPEIGQPVSVITVGRCFVDTGYTANGFEYDLQCEEGVAIVGMGTPDRVAMWTEIETPY